MLEHIYICRHGFRSNWVDPSIKTGPTGMPRDPPLAAYGCTQSDALASFLTDPSNPARKATSAQSKSKSQDKDRSQEPDKASTTAAQAQPSGSQSQAQASYPHPQPERVFSSAFYRCIQTALPTAKSLGVGVSLEHGVGEWYSPTNPSTGLHPRPSPSAHLAQYFPPSSLDLSYTPTLYPSRNGETLTGLQDRADLFIEAWTSRVEEVYPDVKCVVIFAHAASVIALGRALTGNKSLDIPAGCASTSLYSRKGKSRADDSGPGQGVGQSAVQPSGVGEWEVVYTGRADYLENGLERNWSFRDVVLLDGEVITDDGDHNDHPPADELPEGLAPGMERYLRRGRPQLNEWAHEARESTSVKGRM